MDIQIYEKSNTLFEKILRLRYEVLGESLEQLAACTGLVASVIRATATSQGWKRLYEPILMEGDLKDFEAVIRERLEIFNLAKDMILTGQIASCEALILDITTSHLDETDVGLRDVAIAQGILKGLKNSALNTLAEENGVPLLIVKDLTGTKKLNH